MFLRTVSPALIILLLAGCGQSGTPAPDRLAPATPSPFPVAEGAQVGTNSLDVERPNFGHFVFNVDHIQIPSGCVPSGGLPFCPTVRGTFGGRCPVASNFMEFGEGTGEMTHGGRVHVTWSHCTRVSATHAITFSDGTMNMETANGSSLTFSYGPGGLSSVDGGVLIDSPFIITGGTVLFDGASGGGMLHGEAPGTTPGDLLGGRPFDAMMRGTITYAPGRGGQ